MKKINVLVNKLKIKDKKVYFEISSSYNLNLKIKNIEFKSSDGTRDLHGIISASLDNNVKPVCFSFPYDKEYYLVKFSIVYEEQIDRYSINLNKNIIIEH